MSILRSDLNTCNIDIEEIGRDFINSDSFYYGFSDGLFSNLINTGFQANAVNIYISSKY